MRQAIRALGWATKIFWIVIGVFMITCLYSAMNLIQANMDLMMGGRLFGKPEVSLHNGTTTVSLSFPFNNTGFYDISELSVTTRITDYNGTLISLSSTPEPLTIAAGNSVMMRHNISMSLDDMISKNLTYLFFNFSFNETAFNVEGSARLKFAHIFPFQISINGTMPWGAPLNNFSIGEVTSDLINQKMIIPLSFENESPYFDVGGILNFSIYNYENEFVDSRTISLPLVRSRKSCVDFPLELPVDFSKLKERGRIHFFFETSIFSFEKEIKWGDASD